MILRNSPIKTVYITMKQKLANRKDNFSEEDMKDTLYSLYIPRWIASGKTIIFRTNL